MLGEQAVNIVPVDSKASDPRQFPFGSNIVDGEAELLVCAAEGSRDRQLTRQEEQDRHVWRACRGRNPADAAV